MTPVWPNTWVPTRLGEVSEIRSGLAKGRRNLKSPVTRPYLRVANVQDGRLALGLVKEIEVESSEVARYELRCGDVLMTEGGDFDKLGRGTIWQGEIAGCLHQNHVFAVRPADGLLDPSYLAALSASRHGRRYFEECAKQTTNLASINAGQLRAYPLVLPPLAEQRRIADTIAAWGTAAEGTAQLQARKAMQRRGLAEQLLTGKRRFREFVRERWRTMPIGQHLFESRIPGSDGRNARRLTVKLYGKGVVPSQGRQTGSAQTLYYRRAAGQFIYSKLDFLNGACGTIPADLDGWESTLDLPAFDVGPELNVRWLSALVSQPWFYKQHVGLTNGGRKARRMNVEPLLGIEINLPSVAEQAAIVALLDAMDWEIELLVRLRDAYDRQRRAVAELLLTGRVRVPA